MRDFGEESNPTLELAYALTIHKAQGSQVGTAAALLPTPESRFLTRELLYTAVTRARSSLEIWGTEEVFCQTVERRTLRTSGLSDRLAAGGKYV